MGVRRGERWKETEKTEEEKEGIYLFPICSANSYLQSRLFDLSLPRLGMELRAHDEAHLGSAWVLNVFESNPVRHREISM